MASKRRLRRKSCEGKVRHLTMAGAQIQARLARRNTGESIGAYKCKHCKGYHVGHALRSGFLVTRALVLHHD